MNRTLRALVPALAILAATPSLRADTNIHFTGTVKSQDGKPIAGAKVVLRRLDISWKAELTTDASGSFARAGITPLKGPMYEITVTKEGFAQFQQKIVLSLSDEAGHHRDIVLASGSGTTAADQPDAAADPAMKEDTEARTAFNTAIPLYNNKQFAEALPSLEKAYKGMTDAVATMKDDLAKAESQSLLPTISKTYGLALHQVGRDDDAVGPLSQTVDADPKNVKNADAMQALVEIYKKKKDDTNRNKYQALLNAATGTSNASVPYNEGVRAFNANRFKEAKQHLLKAVEADPSFPDSYYLLGLIEMNQGNMAGAKTHFRKYIELAPNGSHAEEVKGALSAL